MSGVREKITSWAQELGFLEIGFAKAEFLEEEAPRLEQWLQKGYHGQMRYMENWFDKRLDPRLLVEDAQSVIVLSYNYYTDARQMPDAPVISTYAYGEDYHHVIKNKLKTLLHRMQESFGAINGRGFVDSAPVMERAWAKRAGLGWTGKHTLLISKDSGSFFFLAVLITDLPIEPDPAFPTDHCGTCTRCIDACPTDAIVQPYLLDASRCISYLTIELKEAIPEAFKGQMKYRMFGCDICQDVCPWNRFSTPHTEAAFNPHPDLLGMTKKDWTEITQDVFGQLFKKSAVKRTGFEGLKRNLAFLSE